MLTIRLQRAGKKNRPEFRVVLAEKTASASKKFIEVLGSYNPRTKLFLAKDLDRIKYWVSEHIQISPTVHNLFVTQKVIEGAKVKAFTTPKKPAVEEKAPQAPKVEVAPVTTTAPVQAVETPVVAE